MDADHAASASLPARFWPSPSSGRLPAHRHRPASSGCESCSSAGSAGSTGEAGSADQPPPKRRRLQGPARQHAPRPARDGLPPAGTPAAGTLGAAHRTLHAAGPPGGAAHAHPCAGSPAADPAADAPCPCLDPPLQLIIDIPQQYSEAYPAFTKLAVRRAVADAIIAHAGLPAAGGQCSVLVEDERYSLVVAPATAKKGAAATCCLDLMSRVGVEGGQQLRLVPLPGGEFGVSVLVPLPAAPPALPQPQPPQPHAGAGVVECPAHVCKLAATAFQRGVCSVPPDKALDLLRHAGYAEGAMEGQLRCTMAGAADDNAMAAAEFKVTLVVTYYSRQQRLQALLGSLRPLLHALVIAPGQSLRLSPQAGGTFLASVERPARLTSAPGAPAAAVGSTGTGAAVLQQEQAHTHNDDGATGGARRSPSHSMGGAGASAIRGSSSSGDVSDSTSDASMLSDSDGDSDGGEAGMEQAGAGAGREASSDSPCQDPCTGPDLLLRVRPRARSFGRFIKCSLPVGRALLAHAGLSPAGGLLCFVHGSKRYTLTIRVYESDGAHISLAEDLLLALGADLNHQLLLSRLPGGEFGVRIAENNMRLEQQRLGLAGLLHKLQLHMCKSGVCHCNALQAQEMLRHAGYSTCLGSSGMLRCRVESRGGGGGAGKGEGWFHVRLKLDETPRKGCVVKRGTLSKLRALLAALGLQPGDWLRLEPTQGGTFAAARIPQQEEQQPRQQGGRRQQQQQHKQNTQQQEESEKQQVCNNEQTVQRQQPQQSQGADKWQGREQQLQQQLQLAALQTGPLRTLAHPGHRAGGPHSPCSGAPGCAGTTQHHAASLPGTAAHEPNPGRADGLHPPSPAGVIPACAPQQGAAVPGRAASAVTTVTAIKEEAAIPAGQPPCHGPGPGLVGPRLLALGSREASLAAAPPAVFSPPSPVAATGPAGYGAAGSQGQVRHKAAAPAAPPGHAGGRLVGLQRSPLLKVPCVLGAAAAAAGVRSPASRQPVPMRLAGLRAHAFAAPGLRGLGAPAHALGGAAACGAGGVLVSRAAAPPAAAVGAGATDARAECCERGAGAQE